MVEVFLVAHVVWRDSQVVRLIVSQTHHRGFPSSPDSDLPSRLLVTCESNIRRSLTQDENNNHHHILMCRFFFLRNRPIAGFLDLSKRRIVCHRSELYSTIMSFHHFSRRSSSVLFCVSPSCTCFNAAMFTLS